MEPLLTWRYYLIPSDKFEILKPLTDQMEAFRDRELSPEEDEQKEKLIDELNTQAASVAYKVIEYRDDEARKDGTVIEELVYRMDEAGEVDDFSDGYYFKFLVYASYEDLKKSYPTIEKIFNTIKEHDLLKREFLGESKYLTRAREIFEDLRAMYKEALDNNCGILKTDKVEWIGTANEEDIDAAYTNCDCEGGVCTCVGETMGEEQEEK